MQLFNTGKLNDNKISASLKHFRLKCILIDYLLFR